MRLTNTIRVVAIALLSVSFVTVTASAVEIGSQARGETFALEVCATCHVVSDRQVSVDIVGLPSFREVANDPSRTEFWLRTFLRTPHFEMPNFILTQAESDDIVAYVGSLKRW